ncbi:dual specificity testis-specific protein kinase 1-like [Asterias amurensis]|uniref:dual specificity testis-specific protein kinase 1-like n=1 Tax=Asterias amurensis TaxID=7602 RepID=UPI003AB60FAA
MSQCERLAHPSSLPLLVSTTGNPPGQGTNEPDNGLVATSCPALSERLNSERCAEVGGGGGVREKRNIPTALDLPCEQTRPPPLAEPRPHPSKSRIGRIHHNSDGYGHGDGHDHMMWGDGRHRTFSRTQLDDFRPLSPGSSAVAMKTLLSRVAKLDDFVTEKIGSGFFSDVFKVQSKATGEIMVLKMNNGESCMASVIQEIQLLKKLQHPNIIKLLGVCAHESNIHALIEYMNGGDLSKTLLDMNIYLSWPARIRIAKDIASGMSYLHMHCIIHRDLTSMNCLIRKNSNGMLHAVVADLGLAARIPRDKSEQLATVGTPFWVSPENLRGDFYTEKTDLFSFGIILCEIIARVTANPDELPRLGDFGLDKEAFRMMTGECPEQLLLVAFSCCDMVPSKRPAFTDVVLSIRNIESDFERMHRRPPSLSGRMRSQSTASRSAERQPGSKKPLVRSPRNSVIRSNSDSGSRPGKIVSKKWVNPFDTPHLKNGQTKLTQQTEKALFQLPPEIVESLQAMCIEDEEEEAAEKEKNSHMRQRSQSLPNSPVVHRWNLKVDENTNLIECPEGDDVDAMTMDGRRNTMSPGFAPPPSRGQEYRTSRARSKTTSVVL